MGGDDFHIPSGLCFTECVSVQNAGGESTPKNVKVRKDDFAGGDAMPEEQCLE
jgi:hypothetical protein